MSEPRLIISYLLWECDHGNANPEVRMEGGALRCETCSKVVTQWITRTTGAVSMDDFPELGKLSPAGRIQLMAFAERVREAEKIYSRKSEKFTIAMAPDSLATGTVK